MVVWSLSALYMWHFGPSWHLDLRVYRAADRKLFAGGNPFVGLFTANKLPFTYPPFALVALSPLDFGPLGLVEALWWLIELGRPCRRRCSSCSRLNDSRASDASERHRRTPAPTALPRHRRGYRGGGDPGARTGAEQHELRTDQLDLDAAGRLRPHVREFEVARRDGGSRRSDQAHAARLPRVLPRLDATRSPFCAVRATFVVATAATWLALPSESALYWFHEVADPSRTGDVGGVSNQSWDGLLNRAPFHGGGLATALWVVLCVRDARVRCPASSDARASRRTRPRRSWCWRSSSS